MFLPAAITRFSLFPALFSAGPDSFNWFSASFMSYLGLSHVQETLRDVFVSPLPSHQRVFPDFNWPLKAPAPSQSPSSPACYSQFRDTEAAFFPFLGADFSDGQWLLEHPSPPCVGMLTKMGWVFHVFASEILKVGPPHLLPLFESLIGELWCVV